MGWQPFVPAKRGNWCGHGEELIPVPGPNWVVRADPDSWGGAATWSASHRPPPTPAPKYGSTPKEPAAAAVRNASVHVPLQEGGIP